LQQNDDISRNGEVNILRSRNSVFAGEKSSAGEQILSFLQGFVKLVRLFSARIIVAVYCQNIGSNCAVIRQGKIH